MQNYNEGNNPNYFQNLNNERDKNNNYEQKCKRKRKSRQETMSKKQKEEQKELNLKNNVKNTYIDKINSLITNNNDMTLIVKPEEKKSLLKND